LELQRLAAIAEPAMKARCRRPGDGTLGVTGSDLALLAEDEMGWDGWLETFARYRGHVDRHHDNGCGADHAAAAQPLLALPSGERRLTNVLHCCDCSTRLLGGWLGLKAVEMAG
jgi:hypothetical protein